MRPAALALALLFQLPSGATAHAEGFLVSPQFGVIAQPTAAVARREARQQVWAYDHGQWRNITPRRMRGHVWAVDFMDERDGWIFAGDCTRGFSGLFRTGDGGRSWATSHPRAGVGCHAGDRAQVDFVDRSHGWLLTVAATGHGASLFRTIDGGRTWREVDHILPTIGRVRFRTVNEGWLARSDFAPHAGVWRSSNGGRVWRRVRLEPPSGWGTAKSFPDVPVFFGTRGVLAVTLSAPRRSAVAFYVSSDSGRTWHPGAVVQSQHGLGASGPHDLFPSYAVVLAASPEDWWLVQQGGQPRILVTHTGGRRWSSMAVPVRGATLVQLSAADGRHAWLTAEQGSSTTILATSTGGRTWRRLQPSG